VILAFGARLPIGAARCVAPERARAAALARLVRAAWADGPRLLASEARPLYLRDKVAYTSDELQARRAAAARAPA
jgi:tRNA threonylcarbamoyladenosine biosynthesis protein TsaB